MPNSTYQDNNLTVVTINDFSAGVYTFSKGVYGRFAGAAAPIGSACQAYRCYYKKGIGLIPFPRYGLGPAPTTPLFQPTGTTTGAGSITIGGMKSLMVNGAAVTPQNMQDILVYNYTIFPAGTSGTTYNVDYLSGTAPIRNNWYTHTVNSVFLEPGNMDVAFFTYGSPATPQRCIVSVDPTNNTTFNGTLTWVTIPAWNNVTSNGNLSLLPAASFLGGTKVFYVNGRACFTFFGLNSLGLAGFPNFSAEALFCTDVQAMTTSSSNTSNPNYFYPEAGIDIGSWGSISDGEFFFVFRGGGAVIVYGDIDNPQSVVKLPGVVGTGGAIGPAAQTPAGLIYVTDSDGAYLWNGGNTSQKISDQIPDDQLYRSTLAGTPASAANDVWGNWYMAANNWMFDIETGGWWQVEDPNILSFQVHASSVASLTNFYSSDGIGTNSGAGSVHCNIFQWFRTSPQQSYVWTSSAIANPGQLVDMQWVEICATNPTGSTCTIVVQPIAVSPAGISGSSLPNPNLGVQGPPVTFTIPSGINGYRESARLGYSDYNICIRVTATNTSAGVSDADPAPILHELSVGFTTTRPSGAGQ